MGLLFSYSASKTGGKHRIHVAHTQYHSYRDYTIHLMTINAFVNVVPMMYTLEHDLAIHMKQKCQIKQYKKKFCIYHLLQKAEIHVIAW